MKPLSHNDLETTERLVLRPFAIADAPLVSYYAGDKDVASRLALIPSPFPVLSAEGWIMMHEFRRARGFGAPFAVTRKEDGALVGAVGASLAPDGAYYVSYWLGKPHWRQGYAAEALAGLITWAAANLEPGRPVLAWRQGDNDSSAKALAKAGFCETGQSAMRFSLGLGRRAPSVLMERPHGWGERPAEQAA